MLVDDADKHNKSLMITEAIYGVIYLCFTLNVQALNVILAATCFSSSVAKTVCAVVW